MRPPRRVTVAGVTYRVEQAPIDQVADADTFGTTSHHRQLIRLHDQLEPDRARLVLLHELGHVAWHLAGVDNGPAAEHEEAIMAAVTPGLLAAIRQPGVAPFLLER